MKAKAKVISVDVSGVGSKVNRIKGDPRVGTGAATDAMRLMDKYVPFRSGALSGGATVEPWKVVYAAPYARYVYEGRNMKFSTQFHPLARSHWNEPLDNDTTELAAKITQRIEAM